MEVWFFRFYSFFLFCFFSPRCWTPCWRRCVLLSWRQTLTSNWSNSWGKTSSKRGAAGFWSSSPGRNPAVSRPSVFHLQVRHRPGGDGLRSEQEEDDPTRCVQGAGEGRSMSHENGPDAMCVWHVCDVCVLCFSWSIPVWRPGLRPKARTTSSCLLVCKAVAKLQPAPRWLDTPDTHSPETPHTFYSSSKRVKQAVFSH